MQWKGLYVFVVRCIELYPDFYYDPDHVFANAVYMKSVGTGGNFRCNPIIIIADAIYSITFFLHARFHMHAPHATANCLSEIPQLVFFYSTLCALRFVLAACSIHVVSEIPQLFSFFCSILHDMRAARY
jgi:hypothetical protein